MINQYKTRKLKYDGVGRNCIESMRIISKWCLVVINYKL